VVSVSAEVSENSIQIRLLRRDVLLFGLSLVILIVLWVVAGWRVALLVMGLGAFGTAFIDEVQRSDISIFGR
jgi:uncharacterized membrane protein